MEQKLERFFFSLRAKDDIQEKNGFRRSVCFSFYLLSFSAKKMALGYEGQASLIYHNRSLFVVVLTNPFFLFLVHLARQSVSLSHRCSEKGGETQIKPVRANQRSYSTKCFCLKHWKPFF